jgi:alpha-2-macroglobulin
LIVETFGSLEDEPPATAGGSDRSALLALRLTMVAPSRRYHVALVDPLPAGFESLNPLLAVTESIPEDQKQASVTDYGGRSYGYGHWWPLIWFDHQNLRDDRAEAFTSLLWEGVYNYSYVARATTPGEFVVPPVKSGRDVPSRNLWSRQDGSRAP